MKKKPDHETQKWIRFSSSMEERLKELVEALWRDGGDLLLKEPKYKARVLICFVLTAYRSTYNFKPLA